MTTVERHHPIPLPLPRGGGCFRRINGYWYCEVHGALVVSRRPGTPRLTADDVPPLPPGYRDEIIAGRLIVTPGSDFDHQYIRFELGRLMESGAPAGWRAVPDLNVKVDLADDDYCRPDVCVMRPGEKGGLWHTFRQFGLLIEIASPSTQWIDDDDKLRLFAREGVPAYWRVRPAADGGAPTVHVMTEPAGDAYTVMRTVGPGERLSVEAPFPFVLEPDQLTPR